jgi:hypothetical protein
MIRRMIIIGKGKRRDNKKQDQGSYHTAGFEDRTDEM